MAKQEYPVCARDQKSRKDSRLRHYFLCDGCTKQWMDEAFDGTKSLYDGEKIQGYCLLCNKKTAVRLRTWFLCDICDRVAKSIGRNHVAEESIENFWRDEVAPKYQNLKLVRNDLASLRPRRAGAVSGEADIDFLVQDVKSGANVFAIENKTGRSSIKEMSKFQLDVSDCNCIKHAMTKLQIPAFLIHAQVLEIWEPPTMGFRPVGLWWTDVYRMDDWFSSVKMRRDENRGAAYFDRKAFEAIDTFVPQLMGRKTFAILEMHKHQGVPDMYETD